MTLQEFKNIVKTVFINRRVAFNNEVLLKAEGDSIRAIVNDGLVDIVYNKLGGLATKEQIKRHLNYMAGVNLQRANGEWE